jgi:hypothetical protein
MWALVKESGRLLQRMDYLPECIYRRRKDAANYTLPTDLIAPVVVIGREEWRQILKEWRQMRDELTRLRSMRLSTAGNHNEEY